MENLRNVLEEIANEIEEFIEIEKVEIITGKKEGFEVGVSLSNDEEECRFALHYEDGGVSTKQDLYLWDFKKKEGYIYIDVLKKDDRKELEEILLHIS